MNECLIITFKTIIISPNAKIILKEIYHPHHNMCKLKVPVRIASEDDASVVEDFAFEEVPEEAFASLKTLSEVSDMLFLFFAINRSNFWQRI